MYLNFDNISKVIGRRGSGKGWRRIITRFEERAKIVLQTSLKRHPSLRPFPNGSRSFFWRWCDLERNEYLDWRATSRSFSVEIAFVLAWDYTGSTFLFQVLSARLQFRNESVSRQLLLW